MNLFSRFGGRVWDPWREIGQLQHEMGRLLTGARTHGSFGQSELPPVNLYVNNHDLLLTLEAAGLDPAKIDVTVAGNAVTIRGERTTEAAPSGDNFHRRERSSGQFTRSVQLPFEVDSAQTEATYEKGVLRVRMARPESQKPKKVSVKAA
jgi:HSP20 family protein